MRNRFVSIVLLLVLLLFGKTAYAQSTGLLFGVLPKAIEVGNRVTLDVKVNSLDTSINAVSAVISYPSDMLKVVSTSKDGNIISLWTEEPKTQRDRIAFEGVILNPGFQGASGLVFRITFEAKKEGVARIGFSEGALLANDGLGTNLLTSLGSTSLTVIPVKPVFENKETEVVVNDEVDEIPEEVIETKKVVILPVITEYSKTVDSSEKFAVKGKGEPHALTKVSFNDVSIKSLGERFIALLQTKKEKLDDVLLKNDEHGIFEYVSSKNLAAGVYNATPFLVDTEENVEKPGFGVQFLVNDSKLVRVLVVAINVLGLLIPLVGLMVIIYFIPWYSWRRMRVIKKRLLLEEEELSSSRRRISEKKE